MPRFDVVINETIYESRTYSVEARSRKEAAKQAADRWLINGECTGPTIEVSERTYSVDDGNEVEEFGADIENEN